MNGVVPRLPAAVGCVGLGLAVHSGWYVVKGPFFGRPIPDLGLIPAAAAGFVLGVYVVAWSLGAVVSARAGTDRALLAETDRE